MPTLHLMVGLPCSGKTTLAKRLEKELGALRLTADEWHTSMFGQDVEDAQHDARHQRIEALQWEVAAWALAGGHDVVLDFGLWHRSERDGYRDRAKALGAASQIHFVHATPDELARRLERRNAALPTGAMRIPQSLLSAWTPYFEPPQPDELRRDAP